MIPEYPDHIHPMYVFYTPHIDGEVIELPPAEARHALQVLRLSKGDPVQITDGRGRRCTAVIQEATKKRLAVRVIDEEIRPPERSFRVTLAVAPTKNISRMEWLLEKATEIGVDEVIPFFSFHSERRHLRIDRLERIVLAAMKQSQRVWLPRIRQPVDYKTFIAEDFGESQRFMAYIDDLVQDTLSEKYAVGRDVLLAIGPEGGFSGAEVEAARSRGFATVSLGRYRLRTETAALVALHTILLLNSP